MSKITHRHALLSTTADSLFPASLLDAGLLTLRGGPRNTTPDNWTATKSGTWATGANWSAGVPNGSNDATIATAGTYTVSIAAAASAASLTITDANATVADNAGLSLAGTLAVTAGKFVLASNLSGATVSTGTGGTFVVAGGTLSSVSYQGTLDLTAASTSLSLAGSNSFSGTGGTGAATINVTGAGSRLYTYGTQTFDNATLNLGNGTNYASLDEQAYSSAITLTLGSHFNLVQAGKGAAVSIDNQNTGNTLINAGTITAGTAGGTLSIQGPYAGDVFTNTGSIVVGTNATLAIDTNITTGGLGHFSTSGGGVVLLGSGYALSNAGATLALTNTDVLSLAGTITGGSITDSGGGLQAAGGTLSGVTYQGTLAVSTSDGLEITGGFNAASGNGPATINLSASASIYFDNTQTVDNTTIALGSATNAEYLYDYSTNGSASTFTLGSHVNLVAGKNAYLYIDNQNIGNSLINAGTIMAATSGATFVIYGPYAGDVFTNTGTIAVSNNDTVRLQTNITTGGLGHFSTATGGVLQLDNGFVLSNTGATLSLGSGDQLSLAGTITGGIIADTGGGLVASGGTLSGVTYQGTLSLGTGSLNIIGGLNVSTSGSAGVINDIGSGSSLSFYDNQAIDNATLNLGSGGTSYLYEYSSTNNAATLTLGSHFNLVQSGKNARVSIDYSQTANTLINAGTITAATSGGDLIFYGPYAGDTFTNIGTITVSNNDTVDLQVNVTTGGLGHFTTATGGVVQLDSGYTLSNTGATLSLGSADQLSLAGTITGGTIVDSGSGLVASGGTLSGVTYQGTLTLGGSSTLNIVGGLNISNGGSAGTINDSGGNASLYFYDNQTIDNATLNLGNNTGISYLYEYASGGAVTLTLGSHLNLVQSGKNARIYIDQQNIGNTLVNAGTITAAVSGGDLLVYGQYTGDSFTNTGTIAVSNNSIVDLETNVTTGGLGHFSTATGGALQLGSSYTLSNTGATLGLGSGDQLSLSGTITGGTIVDSGNGLIAAGGMLSGVTYQGALSLGTGSLFITGGLNISNSGSAGVINDNGSGSSLYLQGAQTVDNATLNIGNNSGTSYLYEYSNGGPATLTLGSHFNLTETGKIDQIFIDQQNTGNTLINAGTITASISNGGLDIYGQYTGDVFTNTGTIAVSNNDLIDLLTNVSTGGLGQFSTATGGVLQLSASYTLSNTGATLSLGTADQLTLAGTITGGTITDTGNGLQSAGGTLNGVSYQGTLSIQASGSLSVTGGLNISSGGTAGIINETTASSNLYFYGNQTIDNATLNLGNGSGYDYLYVYATGAHATLTLGRNFNLVQAGRYARVTIDQQNVGNTLVNGGTITADNAAGALVISSPYASDKFTNTGSLLAIAGGTLDLSTANLTNLAAGTLTGGSFEADAGSTVELANNAAITTDAATITLSGTGSAIQALNSTSGKQVSLDSKLTTIATPGSLALLAGRNFTASAAFADNGTLQLGGGTFASGGGLTLGTGAHLTGFGIVSATTTNGGSIEATIGTLAINGAVTGTGALQIDAGATLDLQNGASATQTATFAGQGGTLRIDNPAAFAGAIAGFGPGDNISLGTLTATAATLNATSLAITLTGGTVLNETLTTAASSEHLGISADGHTLTAYRFATAAAHTPEPVAFGNHHVGDLVSGAVTLTNSAAADGFSERLDAAAGATTGGVTDTGSLTGLAAGQSSALLSVGLSTATAGAISGTATLNLSTDGAGTDGAAPTAIGTQTVNVTGSVYDYGAAQLANGGTVALGNTHAGSIISGYATLTNIAATGGFSEGLDAAIATTQSGFSASGTIVNLVAGGTDTGGLEVQIINTVAGLLSGTATVTLQSDGAGTSGLGTTALAAQTVTITGAAYAYAQATPANGGTVSLGAVHVGGTASGFLTLSNTAAANGYSEGLDATLSGASAGFSASGSLALLAAGASNSTSLAVGLTAASAGLLTGTAQLALTSDGAGTSNLGTTALAGQTVTITGTAYNFASASVATTLNLGIVHVGSAGQAALSITNAAAAGLYSEELDAAFLGATGAGTDGGTLSLLAAGSTDAAHLLAGIATSASGTQTGTVLLGLVSDGAGTSNLGTTALGTDTITVTGIVDNYAVAAFADPGGPVISGSGTAYSVNLGAVAQGGAALTLSFGAFNAATGTADVLGGTLTSAGGVGFTNTGLGTFTGLTAGHGETAQSVSLSTGNTGVFSETVVLTSAGSNASGYSGALATETLTITGTITTPTGSTTYVLSAGRNIITGAAGGDIFQAGALSLNSHDQLTGGTGTNVLQLIGGGTFDIGAPEIFASIPNVTASEGQAASKTAPDTRQTIFMRDGAAEALTVVAGTAVSGNTNPEAITIYGGTGADSFVLASGQDTLLLDAGTNAITLGGAANSITAGTGTATITGAIATAGASIIGNSTATTTLNLSTAGTATLNAADTYLTVNLAAGTKLGLGAMGFITANGGAGTDTITAGGANQTLIGGTKDILNGVASGADTFLGASAALNGDTIGKWTTGDLLDLTDMNSATLKALTYVAGKTSGTLTVKDGTHTSAILFSGTTTSLTNFTVIGSDGHGGTLIGFHS